MVFHNTDAIVSAMASQITGVSIVYSTVCSGEDQRKHQSSALLAFVMGNSPVTGEFPTQMANNVENASIGWRHHVQIKVTVMAEVERNLDSKLVTGHNVASCAVFQEKLYL